MTLRHDEAGPDRVDGSMPAGLRRVLVDGPLVVLPIGAVVLLMVEAAQGARPAQTTQ